MGDIKNPDCMMASAALDALADCSFSARRGKHPSVTQQARIILQTAADAKRPAKN